ncbi:hypothetical protein PP175_02630 [Aneurinibacillus sp. Ricciae_BoGa-3]|uniref:hypothetical protein n=1 Tax=Aneurinibacillus sp. Ricciae_BoGa-3 TaxID=3022697 RepID=UPI0023419C48|nr:hypothetical protein [Aneurinibacillus sp. Ricciae_BoGa-3]WCK54929.1 hypothetical protein PP175_02630 [Aneurinibacillus sp. Ricciae_BoGa-3]
MDDKNKPDHIESKLADDKNELEDDKKKLEIEVSQMLTQGEMETADPEKAAVDNLPHRYEVRIQAQQDPIVEETKQFRKIAEEVDDRYNKY